LGVSKPLIFNGYKTSDEIKDQVDIVIVGGGIAGLVSSIALVRQGFSVSLLEQKEFPYHKVCGEYISNEARPFLESLDIFPADLEPVEIQRFQMSAVSGAWAECSMDMGGFGISRYTFDAYLAQKATQYGVDVRVNCKVTDIQFNRHSFEIFSNKELLLKAKIVIGAYGKRNKLNILLNRDSAKNRSAYVGIKHHFKADFPNELVALHNFDGGYCGLSKVDGDKVNVCYLTKSNVIKQYKSIEELEFKVLRKNPHLKAFFDEAEPLYDPLVISQINFGMHERVVGHVLMCGDAAGIIHPLCGNGMSMAIHSAKLLQQSIGLFLSGVLSRGEMERHYSKLWEKTFRFRIRFGQLMQPLLEQERLLHYSLAVGGRVPGLLKQVVKLSHGKPF
jgi:flavin-dependent dehydrogenase